MCGNILSLYHIKAGGNMNESFKINVYFDENGEELESLIERLLIDILEKK